MGAGGKREPGMGMPSPKQGGSPFLQNAMQNSPMGKARGNPMQGGFPQMQKQGGMDGLMGPQGGFPQMQQGAAGGKGGMPGAQNPMQQGQMLQNLYMQQMMAKQGGMGPQGMSPQGMAGGKGGMPGAGPAPNAMQQFSQQQGLAGLMQPQQSSTNSLQ